jgi:PAS domain-containing protein
MQKDKLLQAILNNTSEGVLALDPDGRILSWNHAAERIRGFHKDEVVGKKWIRRPLTMVYGATCSVKKAWKFGRPCLLGSVNIERNSK